ncbi:MAG TPA: MFS transporter, partial [Gammaproteobacteria bacterium]|nr:MFS transporter [Gammaproteobacteria bacterium]
VILPILPLFIMEIGGTGLAVGIIAGVSDSLASLLKMVAGYLSDRRGRRRGFVVSGYLLSAAAKTGLAAATVWPHVLALRIGERLGKGLRSAPRDALLAAATDGGRRGRGFGVHRAMDSAGAVLGALLAFGLYWFWGWGFEAIFLAAGLLGFIAVGPLAFVREAAVDRGTRRKAPTLHGSALAPPLRRFLAAAGLFALANFSYMFFVLRSESAFTGALAVGIPILLYALYNVSYTLLAVPAGMLSDRFGRRPVLFAGYGLFVVVCGGFAVAEDLVTFVVLFLLFGANYALVNATERALVSDLAEEQQRGTALGTYYLVVSLTALPGGLLAGLLWDLDPQWTFVYGAVTAAAAIAILWRVPPGEA